MDNILKEIIQYEQQALRLEEEARKEALEIIAEARKKAGEIMEKSLQEGESMVEDLLERARQEGIEEARRHENEQTEAGEQIRAMSRQRLEAAVDYIVERVVNK